MFQNLFGNLLNHLYNFANTNDSVKAFSIICIKTVLFAIYLSKKIPESMEDLAVITALNHFGSFGKYFVRF